MKLKLALLFVLMASFAFAANAQFTGKGRLSGKLLKANGKPLPYTEIELVPVIADIQIPDHRFWATSDARGNFSFKDLPPTNYTLSVNFNEVPTELSPYPTFYYPDTKIRDDAEILKIDDQSNLKNLVFRLPPALPQRTIKGRVVDDKGAGVMGVHVGLLDAFNEEVSFKFDAVTDKDGNFSLRGFEGIEYVVTAIEIELPKTPFTLPEPPTGFGKSKMFTLDADTSTVFILLEKVEQEIKVERNVGE